MNSIFAIAVLLAVSGAAPKQKASQSQLGPSDGGASDLALVGLIDTVDGGYRDGGTPFNGFALARPLSAKGDLSKNEIQPVVKAHHGEINACYQGLLKRNAGKQPVPEGTAMLQFEISPEGKVVSAAIAPGGVDEATFAACVTDGVKKWIFPPPRGGGPVKVSYPVKLKPSE
jgi:TonB family protein